MPVMFIGAWLLAFVLILAVGTLWLFDGIVSRDDQGSDENPFTDRIDDEA